MSCLMRLKKLAARKVFSLIYLRWKASWCIVCVLKLAEHNILGRHFNSVVLNIIIVQSLSCTTTLCYFGQVWHAQPSIQPTPPRHWRLRFSNFRRFRQSPCTYLKKPWLSFVSRYDKFWRLLLKSCCRKKSDTTVRTRICPIGGFWKPDSYIIGVKLPASLYQQANRSAGRHISRLGRVSGKCKFEIFELYHTCMLTKV